MHIHRCRPPRRLFMTQALVILCWATSLKAQQPKPLEFHVTLDPTVTTESFTGRVYVMLQTAERGEPRFGPNWFQPEPFFACDVHDWKPGQELVIAGDAFGFPKQLAKLPKGTYSIQAVMDFNRGAREFSNAAGNGYSKTVRQLLDPVTTGVVELKIDQVVRDRPFPENARVKLVNLQSRLLSDFYGRPTYLRAGVVLPASFDSETSRQYPVIFAIPGFGGNHFVALQMSRGDVTNVAGVEMLYVVLDPDCTWGHHVFADSENNGPVGQALIEELIPHIEQQFRAIGRPAARFVTGHSSGGWSSLWLQVTYADFFGGVWSTSPDPVDFRDFQRINIYAPGTNMFTDETGKPRPIARSGERPILFVQPFNDMENVMGHGGQLGSFEAVFSPRGPHGRPRQLWNRQTGEIDPAVAKHWERYDIRLVLERNWESVGPKLRGKLHVYTGSLDTFYLDGAVALLKESLEKLGSDAIIEIVPGRDHDNLRDRDMRVRIAREMAETFRRSHPE